MLQIRFQLLFQRFQLFRRQCAKLDDGVAAGRFRGRVSEGFQRESEFPSTRAFQTAIFVNNGPYEILCNRKVIRIGRAFPLT